MWGVSGCVTSLWPDLDLSNQPVCLLASWGAGCRHGGSGQRVKGSLCLESGLPPGAHVHAPPSRAAGWSSHVLWMISPLQTLWRQQASLPCRPWCLWWFCIHPLQRPCCHSRLRPCAQKLRAWQPCLRSPGPRGTKVLLATSFSFYS